MKKFLGLMLCTALCFPIASLHAQEKSPEKAKPEEKTKQGTPVKVQVVLTEFDGDKKIASMPYSFITITSEKDSPRTSLRTGARIPFQTEAKEQYYDIGSNIDCGVRTEDDGRFNVYLFFERSSLYPSNASSEEKLEVARPNNLPLVRQVKAQENLILKDGQTAEGVLSTDPLNGHVYRISVTVNLIK